MIIIFNIYAAYRVRDILANRTRILLSMISVNSNTYVSLRFSVLFLRICCLKSVFVCGVSWHLEISSHHKNNSIVLICYKSHLKSIIKIIFPRLLESQKYFVRFAKTFIVIHTSREIIYSRTIWPQPTIEHKSPSINCGEFSDASSEAPTFSSNLYGSVSLTNARSLRAYLSL